MITTKISAFIDGGRYEFRGWAATIVSSVIGLQCLRFDGVYQTSYDETLHPPYSEMLLREGVEIVVNTDAG